MDTHPNRNSSPGQLFVVATPIGNLGDMSYRAVEVLKQVDAIAAEDTRTSRKLLAHYGIDTPMFACHEHNEAEVVDQLLDRLRQGQSLALITDAGTPLISDPGYRIVRALRRAGIRISPIPGASSPIAALSASGLPTDSFTFLGFLPRSGAKRETLIQQMAESAHTHVLLESPHRLQGTLAELARHAMPEQEICVARELTKMFEEFVCGTIAQAIEHFEEHPPRGEIVLVVGPAPGRNVSGIDDETVLARLQAPDLQALSPSARAKTVARELGISKSRAYKLLTG